MAELNPLNGQYSGLWSCELCGYHGFMCRCEHFQRGGNVWGSHGTQFSDGELAAEYWRMELAYFRTNRDDFKEQSETLLRFAENPSYDDIEGELI